MENNTTRIKDNAKNNLNTDIKTLQQLLARFDQGKVLVIGDVMWDKYIYGDVSRISPEAPVPVLLCEREEFTPGGAANVLKNLKALGIGCGIVGILGQDESGEQMRQELKGMVTDDVFLPSLPDRPTISKTRIIARHQQLLRLDRETILPLPQESEAKLLEFLRSALPSYNAVILSDYDKGLLNPSLIQNIIALAKEKNIYVAVDPQVKNFSDYRKADIITPNEKEASAGMGRDFPRSDDEVEKLGTEILQALQLPELLITRSERGMALFCHNSKGQQKIAYIPTIASEVYDVTGAGDTVISVFTAAVACGGDSLQAALLANIAGGLVVKKFGAATVDTQEISTHLLQRQLLYKWNS